MNTRTTIINQPDQTFGHVECNAIRPDDSHPEQWALFIGWDLTLIGGLAQLAELANKIVNAVEAEIVAQQTKTTLWDADDIAVIDHDWVQDNIKNPGEQ